MNELLLLLFVMAIAIGWYLGKREFKRKPEILMSKDYWIGVNHLLNEQHDEAIDAFIKALRVDDDVLETQLALGGLYRKRGEVDKAIAVHQKLLDQLDGDDKNTRATIELELARDYLKAGLLDRAETLFQQLGAGSFHQVVALEHLLAIYQQEKDWHQAIAIVNTLVQYKDFPQSGELIAHFNCELAIQALAIKDYFVARVTINAALDADANSVRASLLLGQLEYQLQHYQAAIDAFVRIEMQDPWLVSESLPTLLASFDHTHDEEALMEYLQRCLEKAPSIGVIQAMLDRLPEIHANLEAVELLVAQLKSHPSLAGFKQLLDLHISHSEGIAREQLIRLRESLLQKIQTVAGYCCKQCGFTTKKLQWLCPSCKQWGTVKSLQALKK
jgi:lipopolysaccharide biosynthesis regulator YciM